MEVKHELKKIVAEVKSLVARARLPVEVEFYEFSDGSEWDDTSIRIGSYDLFLTEERTFEITYSVQTWSSRWEPPDVDVSIAWEGGKNKWDAIQRLINLVMSEYVSNWINSETEAEVYSQEEEMCKLASAASKTERTFG